MSLSLHLGEVPLPPPPPPAPPAPLGGSPATATSSDDFRVDFRSLAIEEAPTNAATDAVSELAAEIGLPTIREATPVPPYISDEVPVMASPSTGSDTTIVAAIDSGATPMVPGSQPGPITLPPATQPDQSAARAAAAAAMSPLAVEIPPRKPAKRKRARTGLRLVMMLVVLGAVVAGAIVFGRPYLFPSDWAANAQPYADAVEQVTGSSFTEPLTVTSEPTAPYETRMTAQITGDWSTQLPMWRSLGLATGDVTDASLAALLAGWQPAQYSTTDGQIYHDDALIGSSLEAQLTLAMATAWLDQDFGWALGQPDRTLDAAAMVNAEVLAQSTAILRASEYDAELAAPATGPLAYLPAVISYDALAPAMYAPLLPPVAADRPNPLADLSVSPVGGWVDEALEPATPATLAAGDVAVGSPASMDRSFWYLVFAGFVDAPTAYAASESIVESSLTVADRAGTTCAYATFSGGDMIQTPTLRAGDGIVGRHAAGDDGRRILRRCRRWTADGVVRPRGAGTPPDQARCGDRTRRMALGGAGNDLRGTGSRWR